MKLSKGQKEIVEELMGGGVIWILGTHPYIAKKDNEGRMKSEPLHLKTFNKLCELGIIQKKEDGRWHLKA